MNVRSTGILATARHDTARRTSAVRARRRGCAIETLEVRGLLSAVTPIRSALLDVSLGNRRPAAEIASTSARPGGRDETSGGAASGAGVRVHETRPNPANALVLQAHRGALQARRTG